MLTVYMNCRWAIFGLKAPEQMTMQSTTACWAVDDDCRAMHVQAVAPAVMQVYLEAVSRLISTFMTWAMIAVRKAPMLTAS